MIAMGAGTNHWFHSDQIYRTFLALVMLCGCEGVNGGGWAHYVGQEKVPAARGLADDRVRAGLGAPAAPPVGHAVLLPGDRPVALRALPALGPGLPAGTRAAGGPSHRRRQRARGAAWVGCRRYPSFDRNPLDLVDEARARRASTPAEHVVSGAARRPAAVRLRGPRRARELIRR